MNEVVEITDHCKVKDRLVTVNDNVRFRGEKAESFGSFAKAYYRELGLKYPKFHKMDNLSKLGFLAAESLLQEVESFEGVDKAKTGIFLSNAYSCLDTDERYYNSITDIPSPGLFVYTLPNILIGEICIRHKITGEHAFFLSEQFDLAFVCQYVTDLFRRGQLEGALVGWVEYYDVNCQAFLMWLEPQKRNESNRVFTPENALKLFEDIRP